MGVDLEKDPIYLKRLQEGLITHQETTVTTEGKGHGPLIAVVLFLMGVFSVVLFGSISSLRPSFIVDGASTKYNDGSVFNIF